MFPAFLPDEKDACSVLASVRSTMAEAYWGRLAHQIAFKPWHSSLYEDPAAGLTMLKQGLCAWP